MGERCRPRDLYDIVNLFRRQEFRPYAELIRSVYVQKCQAKGLEVYSFDSLEHSPYRAEIETEWANMLGHQLPVLPPFDILKDQFAYHTATDSYLCPHGHRLPFRGLRKSQLTGLRSIRVYRASRTACRTCPAFGVRTKDKRGGRALWIGPSDVLLRKHRQWMRTDEAQGLYARRKELSEPTFGILKDQLGARRFLLRGLANVRAEFASWPPLSTFGRYGEFGCGC